MAVRTQPITIQSALRVMHDLNVALNTWSTSQRVVIGLAADFAESGEWAISNAVSAAHWRVSRLTWPGRTSTPRTTENGEGPRLSPRAFLQRELNDF
ncbi:MAG TPA: hypothetical protein PK020_20260 [Ilumatobacteraceae bacterium]|nr:hypothetical protein [Ilumatobacteraceae bacterium]